MLPAHRGARVATGGHMRRLGLVSVLVFTLSSSLLAQAPTGAIAGTVIDQQSAVLPKATVTVVNKNTGASRIVQTAGDGTFSVPSLLPGPYEVLIEMSGFQ